MGALLPQHLAQRHLDHGPAGAARRVDQGARRLAARPALMSARVTSFRFTSFSFTSFSPPATCCYLRGLTGRLLYVCMWFVQNRTCCRISVFCPCLIVSFLR